METTIKIGDRPLDTQIELQKLEQKLGAQGQKTWAVTARYTVWAHVERNVNEGISDENLEANASLMITIYKVSDLSTRWRVVVEGKPYEVRSIDPISRASLFCTLNLTAIDG